MSFLEVGNLTFSLFHHILHSCMAWRSGINSYFFFCTRIIIMSAPTLGRLSYRTSSRKFEKFETIWIFRCDVVVVSFHMWDSEPERVLMNDGAYIRVKSKTFKCYLVFASHYDWTTWIRCILALTRLQFCFAIVWVFSIFIWYIFAFHTVVQCCARYLDQTT